MRKATFPRLFDRMMTSLHCSTPQLLNSNPAVTYIASCDFLRLLLSRDSAHE